MIRTSPSPNMLSARSRHPQDLIFVISRFASAFTLSLQRWRVGLDLLLVRSVVVAYCLASIVIGTSTINQAPGAIELGRLASRSGSAY